MVAQVTLRYGHGKPVHPELEALLKMKVAAYDGWLDTMLRYEADYQAILEGHSPMNPDFYTGATLCLDCAAIHAMVSIIKPRKWVEVGSGHSTAFALNAALMHSGCTKFEVVDPAAGEWTQGPWRAPIYPTDEEVEKCRA